MKTTSQMASSTTIRTESNNFQPAEVVIVACNGVGTPRLLLNSTSARFPDGLANRSGLVGKNLMFHPYAVHSRNIRRRDRRATSDQVCASGAKSFYETDSSRGHVRGFTYECNRGRGAGCDRIDRNNVWSHTVGCATPQRVPQNVQENHRHGGDLRRLAGRAQYRHVGSRIERFERHSSPKIDYTLSKNSRNMLDFSIARASEVLRAAGAHDIMTESPIGAGGWHLMGTARMGTDPESSVVNEWGRSHDVRICSSSTAASS